MKNMIRVATISPEVHIGNVDANIAEINREAKKISANIIVTPELSLVGYTTQDLLFNNAVNSKITDDFDNLAAKLMMGLDNRQILIVGAPIRVKDNLYNCAIIVDNSRVLGIVPKCYLPNYNEFYEKRWFKSAFEEELPEYIKLGTTKIPFGHSLLFDSQGFKFGVEICEDLWVPLPPSTKHCLNGATLIVNPSASNDLTTKSDYRRLLVSSHSARLICGYAYCNAGLGESTTDVVFSNHHIIAENGKILEESVQYEEGLIYSDVDLDKLVSERIEMTTYENRNDGYDYIPFVLDDVELDLDREYDPYPFVPSDKAKRAERCKEVFDIQIHGLIQRIQAAHIQKVVIGISGGLDSTLALLVASMAYQKLGYPSKNIIAVTMPCFGTTSRTKNNALKMMEELNVTSLTVNIADAVNQHFQDIQHDPEVHDVTYENCQARERTQVLMDIANQEGGIVIGTGDLSEVALGWSTYNGDHMSMYAVNVSVPKTLVRYLVDYVSSLYKGQPLEATLQDILDTPVSPELLPAKDNEIVQKTEDIVGPYELHDFFLYHHVRFHYEPRKLYRITKLTYGHKYDDETIKKWLTLFYRRFFTQQFKRSCIPDGPKVGSVALSPRGDLRMPSDANVTAWLKECENL